MSLSEEERKARRRERDRARYEANREAVRERKRAYREANREAVREQQRAYYEANREAVRERRRAYREANRDSDLERKRAYYEANRDSDLERKRAYREANREAVREQQRAYYEANREAVREQQRAYREANREAVRERQRAYHEAYAARSNNEIAAARARLRPGGLKVCGGWCGESLPLDKFPANRSTADGLGRVCCSCDVRGLWKIVGPALDDRDAFRCVYCDGPAEHVDHVIPRRHGGPDAAWNLAPACAACNRAKNATPVLEFVARGASRKPEGAPS